MFSDFNGLPYTRVTGTPGFFFTNDRKGCKRDYLDARGHFVLRFGAIGEKPLGGGNHPLMKTRVKLKAKNEKGTRYLNYLKKATVKPEGKKATVPLSTPTASHHIGGSPLVRRSANPKVR